MGFQIFSPSVLFSDSCLGRAAASLTRWRWLKVASVADHDIKRNMYHAEDVETKHSPKDDECSHDFRDLDPMCDATKHSEQTRQLCQLDKAGLDSRSSVTSGEETEDTQDGPTRSSPRPSCCSDSLA